MATSAKPDVFDDSWAAVSRASNCRWVNPRVGDSAAEEQADLLGGRVFQQAIDHAGAINPAVTEKRRDTVDGLNRRTSCIHRIQLQVRAARGQRVQATFCAPGQVAAQVGLRVVAGGTLETGQVGSHRQPQLIRERHRVIGQDGRQFGEVPHAQTLRLHTLRREAPNVPGAAEGCAQLRQRLSLPMVGLCQMCFIRRTCHSRLVSCENTSRPLLALARGTGTSTTT